MDCIGDIPLGLVAEQLAASPKDYWWAQFTHRSAHRYWAKDTWRDVGISTQKGPDGLCVSL